MTKPKPAPKGVSLRVVPEHHAVHPADAFPGEGLQRELAKAAPDPPPPVCRFDAHMVQICSAAIMPRQYGADDCLTIQSDKRQPVVSCEEPC